MRSLARYFAHGDYGPGLVRAEELERRLRVDEHGAGVRERREHDREADRQDEEERARHRR